MRSIIILAVIFANFPAIAAKRFECKELAHLHKGSAAYRDTRDACIWDFRHPNMNDREVK